MGIVNDELLGVKVWVPDEDSAWIKGIIEDKTGNNGVIVSIPSKGRHEFSLETIRIANTFEDTDSVNSFLDVTDLTTLTHLHEPSLLESLSVRFNSDMIYTNTGPILIAVNPFQRIEDMYSKQLLLNYYTNGLIKSQTNSNDPSLDLAPHIYKTANAAYRSLLDDEDFHDGNAEEVLSDEEISFSSSLNQSILVSGESGAGKTESTKHIMNYLAVVSNQSAKESKKRIAEMVLKSNPILESFGNARTIRNDNSSRFGKFIEMQFNYKGHLVGARIKTYLLEKVRINRQMKSERNYHIFYQLFKGAKGDIRNAIALDELGQSLQKCALTSMSGCFSRKDGIKDEKKHLEMLQAMEIMSFAESDIHSILKTISALMHLSNVSFVSHLVDGNEGSLINSKDQKNIDRIALVSRLLDLDTSYEKFEASLTQRERTVGNEKFQNVLSVSDANLAKEAVIKTVYSRLFNWIVKRINTAIEFNADIDTSFDMDMELSFIGVLDIFGFEVFDNNSFEQLCINYANETLQQQFNHFVFKVEQTEYRKEEIVWSNINFSDNTEILNLIHAKPISLLSLLNEQCLFPNSTHKTLFNKYNEKLSKNKYFSCSNKEMVEFKFCIEHYAGKVCYNTKSFIEKNKDILFQEALDLLQTSNDEFINTLFPKGEKNEANAQSIQTVTVGTQFKNQLSDLMTVIRQTKPHYVRCLKPNDKNRPSILNRRRLLDQLRYSGVLEAVKVSRLGYPVRMLHFDFLKRYKYISASNKITEMCSESFALKKIEDFQIGLTKVFLRKHAYEMLEQKRNYHRKTMIIFLQSKIRMILARKIYVEKYSAILTIQAFVRAVYATRFVQELRLKVNATRIQTAFRKYTCRMYFVQVSSLVLTLQRIYRGFKVRRMLLEEKAKRCVLVIQKFIRMGKDRKEFLLKKRIVRNLQGLWRIKVAQSALRALRLEAREVGNLQQKITQLQKRNAELEEALLKEKQKSDELENIIDNNEMKEENDLFQEQVIGHRRENAKLLKIIETLRKENYALKSTSATSEEIDLHEFEEPESSSDGGSISDNIQTEMDYWTRKMGEDELPVRQESPEKRIGHGASETLLREAETTVPEEIELRIAELAAENESLKEELKNQTFLEIKKSGEAEEIIRARQQVNELKVAMEALAQENKDYKRANYDLQENMSTQIERVCQAENRSIELEESARFAAKQLQKIDSEKGELKKLLDETLEKVGAMTVLSEQTSAVKIALAKRLEDLLAEKKKLKSFIHLLKKKLQFARQTNHVLQTEIDMHKKAKRPVA